jgi:hypothetical protein
MPRRLCKVCKKTISISQKDWKYCLDGTAFLCGKDCLEKQIKSFHNEASLGVEANYIPSSLFNVNQSMYATHSDLLNMNFRSDYEVRIAEFLHTCSLDFLYEPYTLELDDLSLTPDFYVKPPYDCFIEVKGVFGIGKKKKLKKFLKAYSSLNFIFIPWTMRGDFLNADGE